MYHFQPENGDIETVSERGEGATLTFQCNPGFTPAGTFDLQCVHLMELGHLIQAHFNALQVKEN